MSQPRPLALGLLPHLLPQPIALACRRLERATSAAEHAAGVVDVAITGLPLLAAISTADSLAADADPKTIDPAVHRALTGRDPWRWWELLLELADHAQAFEVVVAVAGIAPQ